MGFELSNLSPGINLIHGPNGSGKSTTAQALHELLWPGRTGLERPSIAGRFKDGDAEWSVSIDAGHVEAMCDGRSGSLPEIGPVENRSRYHLALHELISANNGDFAKQIADESQGGYDLEAAARELRFTDQPSVPRKLSEDLKVTRTRLMDSQRKQDEARCEEDSIPSLREEHGTAIEAANRIDVLQKAVDHATAMRALRDVEIELEVLPGKVAGLKGDERRKLDALGGRSAGLEKDQETQRHRIADAEREFEELKLTAGGITIETTALLESHQSSLKDVETERARREQDFLKVQVEAGKAGARLGGFLTNDQLGKLEQVEIGELKHFAQKADQVRAVEYVLRERRLALEQDVTLDVKAYTGDQIREGIAAMSRWLSSASSSDRPDAVAGRVGMIGGFFSLALGVVLVVVNHWAWAVAVLAGAGLTVFSLRQSNRESEGAVADPRTVHRQSYLDTGLESPENWETDSVSIHLRSLVDLLIRRAAEDNRLRRLEDLQREESDLAEKQNELEQARNEILDRIGLQVEIDDAWLPLLIDNIGQWQVRSSEAAACRRAIGELDAESKRLVEELDDGLDPFGYSPIDSSETAARYIDNLKNRQVRHQAAVRSKKDAEAWLTDTIEPGVTAVDEERLDVFRSAGLVSEEEPSLDGWLAKRETYLDLQSRLSECETRLGDRRKALVGHEDLLDLDPQDIANQISLLEPVSQRRDELSRRIGAIEEKVSELKAGHDFTEALAGRSAAIDAVARARELGDEAVVGSRLASWVKRVAIDRSRPEVFRRAAELVARFSRGTLDLELDDYASPPEFLVCRGTSAVASVETLSVGERVQLLTAIRLAFLETNEQTRLPILLDETLGTCDDSRAGLIIDNIIEIAREGRQVFYFTAQNDEVGKWQARLVGCGVPSANYDLALIRSEAVAAATPLELVAVDVKEPIAPDGLSHSEYGSRLQVPGLNPGNENLDDLHLWHLIEDVNLLYMLLKKQIGTWGQLKTLLKHGGGGLVETNDPQYRCAVMNARVIETACKAWCIGRCKEVDRKALQQSEFVSPSFIDPLAGLAASVGGNAQAIITALEASEIKRWRQANTENLKSYFESQGYLTTEEPLRKVDIRIRVVAAVADDLRDDRITEAVIDRILGSLPI
jgi:hypothetical protein